MSTVTVQKPAPGWGKDLLASIVVFLVAIPLCLGVSIASGVEPAKGLITGIVGGVLVGALAGAPLQVSGPAAGLTVLVSEIILEHGLASLGIIVFLAGLLQVLAGYLRLGQWFRAVSPAIIHGMLAGIGLLIFGSQFHVMLSDPPRGNGLKNLAAIPGAIWDALTVADGSTSHIAGAVGIVTILVLVGWNTLRPPALRMVPAPLVAVLFATGLVATLGLDVPRVSVPDSLFQALDGPDASWLGQFLDPGILGAALAVALIASAETLLSASAVDQMHQGPRTDYNRELVAQGVGNTICGLLEALPMTGVIVRSAANVEAGARSRLSTILHGTWILAFVVLLPVVLRQIPIPALAAILVFTGVKLMNFKVVKELKSYGRGEVVVFIVTAGAIVATNLLEGVMLGIAVAVVKLLRSLSHLQVELREDPVGQRTVLHLSGSATFLRLPYLVQALDRVSPATELHVEVADLDYIDHACLDVIANWEKQHKAAGGKLVIEWGELRARYDPDRKAARTGSLTAG